VRRTALNRGSTFDAIIVDDAVVDGMFERGDEDCTIELVAEAPYRNTARTCTAGDRGFKTACSNARTRLSHLADSPAKVGDLLGRHYIGQVAVFEDATQ